MLKKKIILAIIVLIPCLLAFIVYLCNKIIVDTTRNKLYSNTSSIPFNRVGLLLGTSKFAGGRNNPFYDYRIRAAAELLKVNKIKYLIISGDNSRKDYDEPSAMRADLIREGIDSSVLYLDYAGFRTFDSVVRLRDIFGQDSVTIISQPFHNERAIYLAKHEGLTAIGFNARDVASGMGFRTQFREKFARVKVFLDLWFGKKPKFLGSKITIPG